MIFLHTFLPSVSGRWVGRVQSKGRGGGGKKALSAQHSMQGLERVAGSRPGTLRLPWPPAAAWQGSLAPPGRRTSATWLLAGDLSSSLMAEGLGAELALGTGCSFRESDGSSFALVFRDLLRVLSGWLLQACQVCLYYPDLRSGFSFPSAHCRK